MSLPRCRCGRKAVAFAPGQAPAQAPGGFLVDRGTKPGAWCARCCVARGWLVVAPLAIKREVKRGKRT